ncbi:MAG: hypothetical protein VKO44_01815 [Cyanobacteriota bacterium]|nr:hypothetical protein [Cyanobacteriota bacterium]
MAPDDNGSKQHHPWFPKTDPPQGGGAVFGEWQIRDQRKLGTIADSLVYEVASSRVNSLPSPWSRALQFEQAVVNSRYPTREELLSELLGCFAAVGLWEMFGLKLEAQRVALTEHIGTQDEAVGPFARSLFGARPSGETALYSHPDGSNPWEVVHVLQVDDVVIGFTSPATLLCPAVHLPRPLPGMKWTAGGRFSKPNAFLGRQQKQALADWLSHLRQGLLTAPDAKSQSMAAQLAKVLDDFALELSGGPIGNAILSTTSVSSLPPRPRAIALLARAAKGGETTSSQATLRLGDRLVRPLPQTPERPVILLDPDMPSRLGLPATEITLYKAATLESVGGDKRRLETLYGAEIEVLTPEDVFLSELHLLPGKAALANSWLPRQLEGMPLVNGSPVTPLLPLRERVRELYTSLELSRFCSFQLANAGGGLELKLTVLLPLEGHGEPYPLSRTYALKEANLIDEELPVIAVWPYISDLNWKHYVIFSEDRFGGLSVDGFADYELHKGREGQENVKYFSAQRFPDLIKLTEGNQPRGLLPVTPPPPASNTASSWRVGIDFGTSFTNFFIDEGSGPSRKPLETRVIPLTLAERENQLMLLNKFFIPETLVPKGANPPTSTALNTYGWQETPGTVPELFHQARVLWPGANAQALRGPGIRTGFKWRQLQYQRPFLMELALLISCNAAAAGAAAVEWAVSYPSAFSPNEARGYQRLWVELCKELCDRTGLRQQIVREGGEGGLQTEAVAFAGYFGNHLARQMVHTACLDVGGGTTDISIWQDNTLLHQVSVPFAGRDICTKVMQAKPSFIRFLFTPHSTGEFGDDEAKLRQDPNFNSWLDNCLRFESEELLHERLPIHRAEQNQQLLAFVSLLAISFGGLYHYLGLMLRALAKEGRLRKTAAMPVYMGGNGARFLRWLDESGAFSKGCDADQLMETLQVRSAAFEESGKVSAGTTLSEAFKDETACGLISTGLNLKGDFDPRDELMIAGEALRINGQVFDALDRVALPPEPATIESFALGNLSELRRFLANYDEAITSLRITSLLPVRKLTAIDTLWEDVETQVRAICLERLNQEVSDLEPEPAFIIGLRALSTTLARRWAERF